MMEIHLATDYNVILCISNTANPRLYISSFIDMEINYYRVI